MFFKLKFTRNKKFKILNEINSKTLIRLYKVVQSKNFIVNIKINI